MYFSYDNRIPNSSQEWQRNCLWMWSYKSRCIFHMIIVLQHFILSTNGKQIENWYTHFKTTIEKKKSLVQLTKDVSHIFFVGSLYQQVCFYIAPLLLIRHHPKRHNIQDVTQYPKIHKFPLQNMSPLETNCQESRHKSRAPITK